jgi:hypothetical protein
MLLLKGGKSFTTCPLSTTSPLVGSTNPAIILSVVVFPQPLGPSSEKNCFCSTWKLTWSTATVVAYVLHRSLASTSAVVTHHRFCTGPCLGRGYFRVDLIPLCFLFSVERSFSLQFCHHFRRRVDCRVVTDRGQNKVGSVLVRVRVPS